MDNQDRGFEGRGRGGYHHAQRGDGGGRGGGFRGQRGDYQNNFNRGGRGGPSRGGFQNRGGGFSQGEGGSRLQERLTREENGEDNIGQRRGIQARLTRPGQSAETAGQSSQDQEVPRRREPYRPPNSYSQTSVPATSSGGFGIPPPEEREAAQYIDPIQASKEAGLRGLERVMPTLPRDNKYQNTGGYGRTPRAPPIPHNRPQKTAKTSWKKNPYPTGNPKPEGKQMNKAEKVLHQELAKTVKYPKGINEARRSDYEEMDVIPKFEEDEAEKDREISLQVFEVIRRRAPLTAIDLFKWYQDSLLDKDTKNRLESVEEMEKFIRQHPHVFELDDLDGTVCNKGMGYRRGMVYLACIVFIHEKDRQRGAVLSDIFAEVAALPTNNVNGPWLDTYFWPVPMIAPEQLLEFFNQLENRFIFEVTINDPSYPAETACIRIRDEAKRIPSLWDSTLLIDEDMDKSQTWWDQSRRWVLRGTIAVAQSDYCQAFISRGAFAGRAVYIVPADVGQGTANLATKYQAGNEVEIIAHLCLFGTNHLTGCSLRLANFDGKSYVHEDSYDEVKAMLIQRKGEEIQEKKWKQMAEMMKCDEEEEESEAEEDTDEDYSEDEDSEESDLSSDEETTDSESDEEGRGKDKKG